MAIIKCPECGAEISDKSSKCIHCGFVGNWIKEGKSTEEQKKKNNFKMTIAVVAVLIICLSVAGIIFHNAQNKASEISKLTEQALNYINAQDYDSAEKCFSQLDEIGYRNSSEETKIDDLKEVMNYDKKVYDTAYGYYECLCETIDRLQGYNRASVMGIALSDYSDAVDKLDALEINEKSEIGKYIGKIRKNSTYTAFRDVFLSMDLVSGITDVDSMMAMDMSKELEELKAIPFPEKGEK